MPQPQFYSLVPSAFGALGLVWQDGKAGARVQRVLLPGEGAPAEGLFGPACAAIQARSCPAIDELAERLQRFLAGEAVAFSLEAVALDSCSPFQRRVLLAEHGVPWGWVTTYGCLARHLGVAGGARAVGNALARNPFPILIPCHRAIRGNGALGGFRGGLAMKRALLEMEGVEFTAEGRVLAQRIYYQAVVLQRR